MTPEQRELKEAAQKANAGSWTAADYRAFNVLSSPSAILSLIAQVEALTVPQGSIGSQEFLKWNRSQPIPLVAIPMEMGVYRKAIEIHKALSNSSEIEGIAAPTIPAIPGTKEGA